MPFSAGPNIAARPNLVFEYDTGDVQNSYRGKPTTNFYTNGQFANGAGIPQEQGSNPTNTIIFFPNNPGNSQYVLQQNGNYTEYQIDLTSQLVSNTTYVMSGWYAQSSDYNGSPTMFHARAFSASGNNNATGTGLGTILTTRTVGNTTWSYCYQTITTPSDYSNYFNWYVGYGQPSHNGYRYYTNLQMELGSFPSQFVDGTRSATQGLLDVSGYNRSINISNMSFTSTAFPQMTFDGTDDYIPSIGTAVIPAGSVPYTVSVWVNRGRNNVGYEELLAQWTYANSGNSFFFGFNNSNVRFSDSWNDVSVSGAGNTNVWMNLVGVNTGANAYIYLNGALAATKGSALTYTGTGPLLMGRQGELSGEYFLGRMNNVQIYDSALSAQEVLRNYNQLKGRFNLI